MTTPPPGPSNPPPPPGPGRLTAVQRLDVYRRQTGRSKPTPRQARRMRHKANRELRTS